MTEKRFDIVLVDRIDQNIDKALDQLAKKAATLENAQDRLTIATKKAVAEQARLQTSVKRLSGDINKSVSVTSKATASIKGMSDAEFRAASNRERLRKITAQADTAEERLLLAKQRTAKAVIDVTRAEVALEKARASVNRQSAVVISKNGELEASNERLAASNMRVAATAGSGSRKYKDATAAARQAQAQTSNLIFQVQDIIVGLQGGQKPLTVLLQQGAQIQGAFGPGTGVIAILKGVGRAAIAMAAPFLPFIAVGAAVVGVFALFNNTIQQSTGEAVSMGDTVLAIGQLIYDTVDGYILPTIGAIGDKFGVTYSSIKNATTVTINFIVGVFVGGYNTISKTWRLLPAVVGSVAVQATNFVIGSVEWMIQKTIDGLNALISGAEAVGKFFTPKKFEKEFGQIGDVSLGRVENKFVQDAAKVGATAREEFGKALSTDYVAVFIDNVGDRAVSNMQKRIRKELSGLGKNDTSRTDIMNKEAADIRSVVGVYDDYGQALETAKKRTELLIEAKKKKIEITPGVTAVINDMASAYGQASANLARANALNSTVQAIYEPVTQYAQSISILTEALDKGYISQNQFNASIANSGLVQDLDAVRASLTNTAFAYQQTLLDIDNSTLFAVNAVENAFKAGAINVEQKLALLKGLQDKANLDKSAANDNRTQGIRDFDKGLGGAFKDNAEIEQLRIDQESKLELLRQYREQKLLTEAQYDAREKELKLQTSNEILRIEAARKNVILAGAQSLGDSLASITGDIAGKQSKAYKVMFAASKAFAIAQSIINIQVALSEAAKLPFPLNIAKYAEAAAQGASIISNIKSITSAGFRTGGFTGNGGVAGVAGVVHNREFVIDAPTTAANRPALDNLQRTGRLPSETPKVTPVKQQITNRLELINETGVPMRMEQINENTVKLIAEKVAMETVRSEAPKVIKGDLANPNSDTSKALSNFTTANRKYG